MKLSPHFGGHARIDEPSVVSTHRQASYYFPGTEKEQSQAHLSAVRDMFERHRDTIRHELPDNMHLRFYSQKEINNGHIIPADNVDIEVYEGPNKVDQYTIRRHIPENLDEFWDRLWDETQNLKERLFPV